MVLKLYNCYYLGHAIVSQESYDREYFMLNDKLQKINKEIEALASKPNERRLLLNLVAYRDNLAEKVLQRTLSNRVARLIDGATRKMNDKASAEQATRRDAENAWSREAMEKTMNYFDDQKIRDTFMADAVKQFCAPDAASLKQSSSTVNMKQDLFKTQYDKSYNAAKVKS